MLDIHQATRLITDALPDLGSEPVAVTRAFGRCLAETVTADRDQPPFHRVTMDGIALASGQVLNGRTSFVVAGVHAAGAEPTRLNDPQQCLEVMTGAVLPEGCDCVVPVEELEMAGSTASLLAPDRCQPWRFVHRQGTDYPAGRQLLAPGQRLKAPELAVLAAVGMSHVAVRRQPRVCVVSTGDELVEPGQEIAPQQIRMSNDYAIVGHLAGRGLDSASRCHLRDEPAQLLQALGGALEKNDILVLSGGVSKGKFDYLPGVLKELGVAQHFHRIAQKPGKPMWFGRGSAGQLVFALPGNPVSALVCFARYVVPALDAIDGRPALVREVRLGKTMSFDNNLTRFIPVTLEDTTAWPRELNTSGDFFALAGSDGICQIEAAPALWKAGINVPFYSW